MIKEIEEFHKYIAVSGFKNVRIRNEKTFISVVRKKIGATCVQFFDARFITTREHLIFAALNALKAFESKMNISNSLAMETILYASAQRQITKATKMLGISAESQQVAVLIIADTKQETITTLEIVSKFLPGDRDDGVLELGTEKFEAMKRLFGIYELEISAKLEETGSESEALVDLIIEHMALLTTQR